MPRFTTLLEGNFTSPIPVKPAHLCYQGRLPQDAPANPAPQAHGKPKRALASHYLAITAFVDLSYAPRGGEIRQLRSCHSCRQFVATLYDILRFGTPTPDLGF